MNIFKKIAGLDRVRSDPEEAALYDEAENETVAEEELEEELEQEEEASTKPTGEDWPPEQYEEGQLSIDVYQTPEHLVVKSTIAGVKPEDIDISINNDMLTIRGRREMNETVRDQDYLYRECYWGSFSRSIILPIEIKAEKIEAFLENGVLTVMLPKAKTSKQISIKVRER
jgi:HSP20 family protein